MSPRESRLLTGLLLVVALGATAVHYSIRDPGEVRPEPAPAPIFPPRDEAAVLALGAGAQAVEPVSGGWRLVWKGPQEVLLQRQSLAEAVPGGYAVSRTALKREGTEATLEILLVPWTEGMEGPRTSAAHDAGILQDRWGRPPGRTVPREAARKPEPPSSGPAPVLPGQPGPVTGELILLGSYGSGGGQHWWLKEKATDRVFEVPGAPDWSLEQADGTALIVKKTGILYRVELNP